MNQIQQAITTHFARTGMTARVMAQRTGVSYPILLAASTRGSLPRNPVHREAIRKELDLPGETWARIVASCQLDGVDLAAGDQPTVQQLVMMRMIAQGHSEQTLAKQTGVPYQTLMGMTRRGTMPRGDTLRLVAEALAITSDELDQAIGVSRGRRHEPTGTHQDAEDEHPATPATESEPAPGPARTAAHATSGADVPPLAELIATAITRSEQSVASWAKTNGLPYLSLSRILATGHPPSDQDQLEKLRAALNLGEERFAESLSAAADEPAPARPHQAHSAAATPLQAELLKVLEERHLTTKTFADLAGLSSLTAARLLRQGELPGRATTHEKLRALLGLGTVEYEQLVDRSRQAIAEAGTAAGLAESAEVAAPVETVDPEELVELVNRLAPAQRLAAKRWLTNLLGG